MPRLHLAALSVTTSLRGLLRRPREVRTYKGQMYHALVKVNLLDLAHSVHPREPLRDPLLLFSALLLCSLILPPLNLQPALVLRVGCRLTQGTQQSPKEPSPTLLLLLTEILATIGDGSGQGRPRRFRNHSFPGWTCYALPQGCLLPRDQGLRRKLRFGRVARTICSILRAVYCLGTLRSGAVCAGGYWRCLPFRGCRRLAGNCSVRVTRCDGYIVRNGVMPCTKFVSERPAIRSSA
jgi:hypothetical protein